MLVDTHCHVHFNAYKNDRDEVIRRGLDSDVRMITVGTQKDTSRGALEVARLFDGVYAAVGLHPNHLTAMQFDEDEMPVKTRTERFDADFYRDLAVDPKVVAIGECGIDYYRLPKDIPIEEVKTLQRDTLLAHIRLASELNLPLIIHCRDGSTPLATGAHDDLFQILHSEIHDRHLTLRGVIHSFTGTWRDAERYLDLGFAIGINGIVTFPPRKGDPNPIPETVKKIPLDRLLLETDSPYLTPNPHRGKRNEPAYVRFVAETLASILDQPFTEIESRTTKNVVTLFQRLTP